jgi:hypothetical protein
MSTNEAILPMGLCPMSAALEEGAWAGKVGPSFPETVNSSISAFFVNHSFDAGELDYSLNRRGQQRFCQRVLIWLHVVTAAWRSVSEFFFV